MKKARLFIENFLVYGLGGIISKIIPLIMVPFITRLMPNSIYFGLSDLSNTIISFASSLAIMGMYDAMYRLFFDKEEEGYQKKVCSTAIGFTLLSSVVVCSLLVLARNFIAEWILKDRQYAYLMYLCAIATLVGATNCIVSAPTRMQNKRGIYLITNTISPILSYAIAVPLLLQGHYVLALPLAAIISGVTMEVTFAVLNKSWFSFKSMDKKLLKQLLAIGIPAMPTFLIYWIFNSSDKLMIANILGVSAEGIYSVGSKLGHASQLIYTAFAGGWQYIAFSTMKEQNQVESNSKIFEYLGLISFATTAFICAWSYPIYKLLFVGEYVDGYIVAPYLFLAPLLQMLFQVAGNQFLVIKKSWPIAITLSGGAVLNVVLNLVLIPVLGIEGAAIATLVGYAVSVIVCVIVLIKMKLMVVSGKFMLTSTAMIVFFVLWRQLCKEDVLSGTLLAIGITIFMMLVYRKDIKQLMIAVKSKRE